MPDLVKKLLKDQLDSSLYLHSLKTAEFASKLAQKHHLNSNQAYLAGLLHDNAKRFDFTEMKKQAARYNGYFDGYELRTPALLHAPLGALLAIHDYSVEDAEIIQAIRFHTTGDPLMTDLDKVVFLADGLEESRDFPGVSKFRNLAFNDLDRCLLLTVNVTLEYLKKKSWVVHPRAFKLQEVLVKKLGKKL